MTGYMALLHTLCILAFTVSSLGDHAENCQPPTGQESKSLHDMVVDGLDQCFGKIGNIDLDTLAHGAETRFGTIIAILEYCDKEDLIKNCLSLRSSVCNETQEKEYKFVEDILKIAFSYSCVDSGRYFEKVTLSVYDGGNSTDRNAFTDCVATAKSSGFVSGAQDTSSRRLGFYREFKVFKQCLQTRLRGNNRAVFSADLILNGILRSMKCPHQNGTTILCETLDTTPSTEENVCPYDGVEETDATRFKLINLLPDCLKVNLNQLHFANVPNYTKIEDFRSFFNTYCQNLPHIQNCLSDISSISKVCLKKTDYTILSCLKVFLSYAIETGCKEGGASLATIVDGMLNLAEPAVEKTSVRQCMDEAEEFYKSRTDANATISSQSVLLHRSADSIKQCILDRSSDVGSFKTVFATLVNEILRAAQCIADDGTVVLCETLVNNY